MDFVRQQQSKRKTLQGLTLDIEEERKSIDGDQGVDHVLNPRRMPSDQPPIERLKGTDERSLSVNRLLINNEDDLEKIDDATPPFGSLNNIKNTAGIVKNKTRTLQKEPEDLFQGDISSTTPSASEPHIETSQPRQLLLQAPLHVSTAHPYVLSQKLISKNFYTTLASCILTLFLLTSHVSIDQGKTCKCDASLIVEEAAASSDRSRQLLCIVMILALQIFQMT